MSQITESADLRLAQLLCSRLCHDLIGPAGAINAGLELLADDGGRDDATVALLDSSARRITRQLTFFRSAFGLRGGGRTTESVEEARSAAAALLTGSRMALEWPPGGEAPSNLLRLVLCLILMAVEALPRGGRIRVELGQGEGELLAAVHAQGRGAALPTGVVEALASGCGAESLSARNVPAAYAARLAALLGSVVEPGPRQVDDLSLIVRAPAAGPYASQSSGRRAGSS